MPYKKKNTWDEQNSPEERANRKLYKSLTAQQPAYNDGHELASRLACYVVVQRANSEPLTQAGAAIACNVTRMTLHNYSTGKIDSWTIDVEDRYRDTLPEDAVPIYDYLIGGHHDGKKQVPVSLVVTQYNEIAAMEREERLYKRGSVADIFALKAVDGWQDAQTNESGIVNNTLVISGDSAEKALELLGYKKQITGE